MIDFGFGVIFQPFCKAAAQTAKSWRNDERIYKWCRQSDLISYDDQMDWYERQRKDQTIKMYTIVQRSIDADITSDRLIGVCGLTSIDALNKRAEFSLYIGPEHQRRGLAKRALKTLLRHGFDNLNLHLIWGETFDGNPAAHMFEKLGFVKEGTRRDFYFKSGRYIDAHLYSVKKDEVLWNG